jgi:uncharacterized protein YbjT (DUF2867 family)
VRILLTGATGTAGSGVLRQAIADPEVEGVTVLARREPKERSDKILFVRHDDFADYSAVRGSLVGHEAALWCLGISQFRVTPEQLHRVSVDFVLAGAAAFMAANPDLHFLHLSGAGADPTGRSRIRFAREKGEAERRLDGMGLAGLWHFRPAYIHPAGRIDKPILQDRLMRVLQPAVRALAPSQMVDADDLGRAMLRVAKQGYPERVVGNRAIRRLAGLTRGT